MHHWGSAPSKGLKTTGYVEPFSTGTQKKNKADANTYILMQYVAALSLYVLHVILQPKWLSSKNSCVIYASYELANL